MRAEIIAIGSEILSPGFRDTNTDFLTEQLERLGIAVSVRTQVGDHEPMMESVLRAAILRSELVIATGGLGPTDDDVTRRVVSKVLERSLVLNERVLERIRGRFKELKRPMPAGCEREALVPRGAKPLPNPVGTSPGLRLESQGCVLYLLPGVPAELRAIFEESLKPRITPRDVRTHLATRVLKVTGLPEPEVDQKVKDLTPPPASGITVSILAEPGLIEIHLRGSGKSAEQLNQTLDEMMRRFARRLGKYCFGVADDTLEGVTGRLLISRRSTLSVAESCTGGLMASRLTSVPGSSRYFLGGVVSYSNQSKISLLGVNPLYIERFGAVSSAVALEMAQGVRDRFKADYGVGITGIAGPDGGTAGKPVGLVFISLASEESVTHKRFLFPGIREQVQSFAAQAALDMIRRTLS